VAGYITVFGEEEVIVGELGPEGVFRWTLDGGDDAAEGNFVFV
jgi:hypothetical protein